MITPFVALFIFSFMQGGGKGGEDVVIWNTCVSPKPRDVDENDVGSFPRQWPVSNE